jgi:hypothetical protein
MEFTMLAPFLPLGLEVYKEVLHYWFGVHHSYFRHLLEYILLAQSFGIGGGLMAVQLSQVLGSDMSAP